MTWFIWVLAFYISGVLVMCWLASYEARLEYFRPSKRPPQKSLRWWIWGWIRTSGNIATSWVGVAMLARESVK